jgi:hypothetical protein
MRTPSGEELAKVDADTVIVSADQIKTIFVHYLPREESVSDTPAADDGTPERPE